MNSLKNSILIIKKDLKKSILIYFQLTLIIMYFYVIILNSISYKVDNNNFNKVWKNKSVISLIYKNDEKPSIEEEEKINILKEFLIKSGSTFIAFKGGQIPIKKFDGIDTLKYKREFSGDITGIDDNENSLIEHISSSKELIDEFEFKLLDGRWFTEDEYENHNVWVEEKNLIVPVVLGKNFKDFFKLGDQFKDFSGNINFEVIGFLEDNQYFSSSNLFFYPSKQSSLNNFMITPYKIPKQYESLEIFDGIWKINSNLNYNSFIEKIENKIKELNLNVSIEESSNYLNLYNKSYIESRNLALLQQTLLTLIVIVGITISVMIFIDRNKYMLAVHRAFGATKKEILKTAFLIPNIINLCSLITVIIFIKIGIVKNFVGFNFNVLNKSTNINFKALFLSMLFSIILITISTILPIYKIKNENLNLTMKGD
ncbi:hypothetical protein CYK62_14810 [Clostridium perfringens]|uniref:ABC transporter permease n=1 Tax=Clostridium perfringens TaxID=1502 RepID=UPI000D71B816|nr:ABC transporter permease [Clostridium perfringens]PWW86745.1 hypothetical protein CYK79_16690 [Clostridium perfringens]PWW88605.1 hypothetical protein CYK84_16315 [Clostridium perfringens]PWX18448.1 hypothetical protein CYK62_14810 [Clostridium perfringens]PWX64113.1 hypothetical protein CYK78_16940 [Clostridium perfringens]PZT49240.1 hypothetical protein CYK80_16675 [Clostridium perfringens]